MVRQMGLEEELLIVDPRTREVAPVLGSGAGRQRAAFERSGDVEGVVDDLIARTEASWDARDLHGRL